jgi:hypothetical protein
MNLKNVIELFESLLAGEVHILRLGQTQRR